MAATMKDIARRTGLGLATISSYLNGGNVREKNRIKIEEAIRELHFEVNETARGLKTNKTHTIGVVIPELNSVFCAKVIGRMEDTLRQHGYALMICDGRTDKVREREAVEFLLKKRVDGLINMPVDGSGKHLEAFCKTGKPVVLIDREIPALGCDSVCAENREAVKEAVKLLADHGHRCIGLVAGTQDVLTAQERLQGFKEGCRDYGIPLQESCIYSGDCTIESGVRGLKYLMDHNPDLTAVVVGNYNMTVGLLIGMNELGLSMPDQLSVIGFDNLEFARACQPRLTILDQPTGDIADHAAAILLQRLGALQGTDHIREQEAGQEPVGDQGQEAGQEPVGDQGQEAGQEPAGDQRQIEDQVQEPRNAPCRIRLRTALIPGKSIKNLVTVSKA